MKPYQVDNIMSRVCCLRATAFRIGQAELSDAEMKREYAGMKSQEAQIKKILEQQI